MSLSHWNFTKTGEAEKVLYDLTSSFTFPLLLLDSYMLGLLCACVPIASYIFWVKPYRSAGRAFPILMLWIVLAALSTHWTLSLRQLQAIIAQPYLFGPPLATTTAESLRHIDASDMTLRQPTLVIAGTSWEGAFPLVTETVLLGFASLLFAFTVYNFSRQCVSHRWRYGLRAIIPTATLIMYSVSLAHWTISLRHYSVQVLNIDGSSPRTRLVLLVLLSCNVVMTDVVVLWRMCIVWDRKHPILILATALAISTIGLNIANIIGEAHRIMSLVFERPKTEIVVATYGQSIIGLAAVFVSLSSNFCATALVALKAWLHRRQLAEFAQSHNRRSFAVRVMELLVDSGIVYTAIWVLYCASFFQYISVSYVYENLDDAFVNGFTTAVDHLDAAMAQITSIYPLFVFILVALDKIHYSRAPQLFSNVELQRDRDTAVTVSFEVDVTCRAVLDIDSVHRASDVGRGEDSVHKEEQEPPASSSV